MKFFWKLPEISLEISDVFITLLLGHSRSAHLFGMFFRYRWRYLCFLPTLPPSAVLWGLGIRRLRSCNISNKNLRGWQSFYGRVDTRICNGIGRGGCHSLAIQKNEGGGFTIETAFCHHTKKHSRIASE